MKRPFVVVLLALGLATSAAAQRTTGQIIGKLVDESGSVLPGVTVTLRGAGVAGAPTIVTSDAGVYRFPVLPPGTYDLEYTLTGFATIKREAIPIGVGSVVELNITMKVGSLEESVTVSGASPVVDLVSSEVRTSYNREWVQNAPVRRFSYFDLINSAPGISATSNVGQSTSAQSLGNSTNENSYQIDGTDISATPWPNTDAIEEVEVLQLGASAEYGNVQGAVFNIVTRQGGNAFHGDANFYLQTDGLTGRNTTDAFDKGRPYHRDTWRDMTVQASGPFIRDKLWFFGSLQYQRDWDSQPGVDPRFPALNDSRRVFWKFNYNITPSHQVMHGYHNDYYFIPDTASAFTAPSTIAMNHGDNPTPNLVYTGVLSDKTFVEARYSGFYLHSSNDPNKDGEARVQPRYEDQDTGFITGGITNWAESRSWRYGFQTKLSHLTDKFLGGSHDWKIGLQYTGHGSDNLNGPNDTFLTYSTTGRATTGTTQLPFHQGAGARSVGTYIDDTYRVGRAVVNLGVRYDYSKGMFPTLPFLDPFGNPTGRMSPANDDVYHWNEVSPRVGINYRVNESGKTVVKAHYGRYYKALEAVEFRPAVQSSTTQFNFALDAAGNRSNIVPLQAASLRIDPNFKSAYSDQVIVQLEQQLMTNFGLQVNYVRKSGSDYGAWQDIAGQYVQVPYVDNVGVDASGQTVMVYRLVSNAADRVFLQTNPAGMYMRYTGVTIMGTKRMSHNWQGVVSLVLSKAEGRLGSSARLGAASAQSSQAGTFGRDAAGPNDFVNTDGRLIGDRPVVAKVQLVYRFPWGILAAGNLQHQTGRLYSRAVRVSGLGFPAAPQINMESHTGDRRVADVNLVDLRVQKEFPVPGRSVRFDVFLDALNLTNSDQFESVGSVLGTSSAFGVATRYIAPRRMQVGAKIRW
ncbi:MAG: TonB-dependent receptor [Acidobacteria bacterium]|nr:TonB-dependent receptor [Acidobacteriota bacterium]